MTDRENLNALITAAPAEDLKTAAAFFKALSWLKKHPGERPQAEQTAATILEALDRGTATKELLKNCTLELTTMTQ